VKLRRNQYCPNPRITFLLVARSPSGRERLIIIRRISVHQEMSASVPQALAPLYRQTHAYAVNQTGYAQAARTILTSTTSLPLYNVFKTIVLTFGSGARLATST
jgi:hypothetical protein